MAEKPSDLPAPPGGEGYRLLRELVDRTVDVSAVETLDGIPVVVVEGRRYLAGGEIAGAGEWAEQGATTLGAELSARGVDALTVVVVDAPGAGLGFRVP